MQKQSEESVRQTIFRYLDVDSGQQFYCQEKKKIIEKPLSFRHQLLLIVEEFDGIFWRAFAHR